MSTRHGFLLGTKIIFSLLSLSACVPQCVCLFVCVCVAVSVPLRVCCQWRPLSPCKLSRLKGKSQRRGIVSATLSWARLTHTHNVASPTSHQDTLNQSAVVARNTNSVAWWTSTCCVEFRPRREQAERTRESALGARAARGIWQATVGYRSSGKCAGSRRWRCCLSWLRLS